MKFYDKYIGMKRMPNYLLALIAILVSICMWCYVRVGEQMETQLDVNLDFVGIPPNLIVTSGLVTQLQVRLRGPAVLIRSIPQTMRNYTVNLSMIKKGETTVPMGGEDMGYAYRAFSVIDIQPPSIVVKADTLMERTVPVVASFDYPHGDDVPPVDNFTIKPSVVTIRGPESDIKDIHELPLVIHIDPGAADRTVDETMILNTRSMVTAIPSSVRVGYRITHGREVIPIRSPIILDASTPDNYTVEPEELSLLVELPKAKLKDEDYLSQIRLNVAAPKLAPGESRTVKVNPLLPKGMSLTQPISEEVIVSRIK